MGPATVEAAQAAEATALVLRDGVIMLGAAMLFVTLFRRFGLGAVLGYLVAGALVGPDGLGLVGATEAMLHIADFGIVLLLFLVGLELHQAARKGRASGRGVDRIDRLPPAAADRR